MKINKSFILFITVLLIVGMLSVVQGADRVFLSFAGGPQAGSAVMDSVAAVAGLLNKEVEDVNLTPASSAGASENVRRVNTREADMGGVFLADMYEGYNGVGNWEGKEQPNIRAVGVLYASYTHVVALESSGIKTWNDLVGKKVAVGGQGMGTALLSERLFKELGIWDEIDVAYLGGGNQVTALRDGQIDAFLWSPGYPGPTIVDISTTKDIVLIDVATKAKEVGFFEKYPYYFPGEIPGGTYRGVEETVPVIMSGCYWIANKDLSEDLVYEMTKAAYSEEGVEYLKSTYNSLKTMGEKDTIVKGITIPFHPGARKYWEEIGVL